MASKGRISFADPKDIKKEDIEDAFTNIHATSVELIDSIWYVEFNTSFEALEIVRKSVEIKGTKIELIYVPIPPPAPPSKVIIYPL